MSLNKYYHNLFTIHLLLRGLAWACEGVSVARLMVPSDHGRDRLDLNLVHEEAKAERNRRHFIKLFSPHGR